MFATHKSIRKIQQRDGATLVEFAFVAPTFLLIIWCCFEFGRMSMMKNLAQNAAYEACRFAMMEGATEAQGEAVADQVLARLGTTGATVTTTYQPILRDDGTVAQAKAFVKTTVSIPIGQNSLVFPSAVFGSRTLDAEAELRSERYLGYFESQ